MSEKSNSRTIAIIIGVILVLLVGVVLANPGLLNLPGAAGLKKDTDTPAPQVAATDTQAPAPTDTQAPPEPTKTKQNEKATNTPVPVEPTKTKSNAKDTDTPAPSQPTDTPKANGTKKITLCHATGSATNPFVEITISYNG